MATAKSVETFKITVPGGHGAGPVSAPGVKAGDVVLSVMQVADGEVPAAYDFGNWEMVISGDDQIVQTNAADRSARTYTAILYRGAAI